MAIVRSDGVQDRPGRERGRRRRHRPGGAALTGFTLTRLARGLVLERIALTSDNAADIEAGNEVVLLAEDVVCGHRADVHDGID